MEPCIGVLLRRISLAAVAGIVGIAAASSASPAGAQWKPPRPPTPVAVAKPNIPPSADSLSAISRRGRALAEYDAAAWLGADAMTSLSVASDGIRRLIVRRTGRSWEVAVGTLSAKADTFNIEQLATPGIQPNKWASTLYEPAEPDTGYFLRAARAVEASIAMFRPAARRPYAAMAIPADDGASWWVYIYPTQIQAGLYPRGGDMRFRVSADGGVVLEFRQMHDDIDEYSARTARSSSVTKPQSQAVVSGEAPEDTDVFHVIQRRPALPELVRADHFQYRIDVDGSVRVLGPRP
jgi:hypothetical protein